MGSESVSDPVSDGIVTFVYGTTSEDTDESIIWRTCVACWMTTVYIYIYIYIYIYTHTHPNTGSECLILIAPV